MHRKKCLLKYTDLEVLRALKRREKTDYGDGKELAKEIGVNYSTYITSLTRLYGYGFVEKRGLQGRWAITEKGKTALELLERLVRLIRP